MGFGMEFRVCGWDIRIGKKENHVDKKMRNKADPGMIFGLKGSSLAMYFERQSWYTLAIPKDHTILPGIHPNNSERLQLYMTWL